MITNLHTFNHTLLSTHPTTQKASPFTLIIDFDGLFFKERSEINKNAAPRVQTLSPTHFASTLHFLHDCVKKGHKLFSITTLSSSFFEFLKAAPQTDLLFSYFDEIICTDTIGFQKSDPQALRYVLRKHMIIATTCIVIDDQQSTLHSAREVGISKTILCKNSNLVGIRHQLSLYGVL
jgi:FMN phosphatase YigB (HAD superfamily)